MVALAFRIHSSPESTSIAAVVTIEYQIAPPFGPSALFRRQVRSHNTLIPCPRRTLYHCWQEAEKLIFTWKLALNQTLVFVFLLMTDKQHLDDSRTYDAPSVFVVHEFGNGVTKLAAYIRAPNIRAHVQRANLSEGVK